jgi:hypothetical protein
MNRLHLFVLALVCLAACTPVPRPFSAQGVTNPLVEDRRVTSSVQIVPVAQYPGLAEAIVHDLAGQDVLATTHDPGARKVLVTGTAENHTLVWRAATGEHVELGSANQLLAPGADIRTLARGATPLIIGLLTAEGAAPDPNQPHVAVLPIHGPKDIQWQTLDEAMADALRGRGVSIGDKSPVAVIQGEAHVTPGSGGQDVLQIDWFVRDAKGETLGKITQGSPVAHKTLTGPMNGLARDIAVAGAPGIVSVLRQKLPDALGAQ